MAAKALLGHTPLASRLKQLDIHGRLSHLGACFLHRRDLASLNALGHGQEARAASSDDA